MLFSQFIKTRCGSIARKEYLSWYASKGPFVKADTKDEVFHQILAELACSGTLKFPNVPTEISDDARAYLKDLVGTMYADELINKEQKARSQ